MKRSFTREELLRWMDANRAEAVVGPNVKAPQKSWTTEDINRAWSASAQNVLSMLEELLNKS